MKTKKLKYKPDYNFYLIGISCADEDYKLSWEISQILKTSFVKTDNLEINDPRFSEYLTFSVFTNIDKSEYGDIKLVSNKGKEGFLVEELKNIDFFLIVNDDEDTNSLKEFVVKLKQSDIITAVFKLEPEKLKSKEKLLF